MEREAALKQLLEDFRKRERERERWYKILDAFQGNGSIPQVLGSGFDGGVNRGAARGSSRGRPITD